jgi:LemA protein
MNARAALALPLAALVAGCGVNSIPTAEENVNAKWANVQVDYQRRANLIPNLVATVKASVQGEDKVLTDVINARAKATSVQVNAADLTDPAKVQAFQQAQGALTQSFGRLMAVAEQYPEVKSQQNFPALMSEIEGSENRIAIAIQDYNSAVQQYNTLIRTFPAAIGAKVIYGAKPKTPYQATTPGAENAPAVNFGNGF